VNVAPLTIEAVIRSGRRDRPLLVGWITENIVEAAHVLWPEFVASERPDLDTSKLSAALIVTQPKRRPRWVRRLVDPDE
jgi:hypothetical protein